QIEVAECRADSDIGEREGVAVAPGLFTDVGIDRGDGAYDALGLAVEPARTLLALLALAFEKGRHSGFAEAGAERVPARDDHALRARRRGQLIVRRAVVQVFDDDARVINEGFVVKNQDGNLTQRIAFSDVVAGDPRRLDKEFAFDLFFSEDDAGLAYKRAGIGADQLHIMFWDSAAGSGRIISLGPRLNPDRRGLGRAGGA